MDIAIIIPNYKLKKITERIKKAKENKYKFMVKLKRYTKYVKRGDTCYFIFDGLLIGSQKVNNLEYIKFDCEINGEIYKSGWYLVNNGGSWKELNEPFNIGNYRDPILLDFEKGI